MADWLYDEWRPERFDRHQGRLGALVHSRRCLSGNSVRSVQAEESE